MCLDEAAHYELPNLHLHHLESRCFHFGILWLKGILMIHRLLMYTRKTDQGARMSWLFTIHKCLRPFFRMAYILYKGSSIVARNS